MKHINRIPEYVIKALFFLYFGVVLFFATMQAIVMFGVLLMGLVASVYLGFSYITNLF